MPSSQAAQSGKIGARSHLYWPGISARLWLVGRALTTRADIMVAIVSGVPDFVHPPVQNCPRCFLHPRQPRDGFILGWNVRFPPVGRRHRTPPHFPNGGIRRSRPTLILNSAVGASAPRGRERQRVDSAPTAGFRLINTSLVVPGSAARLLDWERPPLTCRSCDSRTDFRFRRTHHRYGDSAHRSPGGHSRAGRPCLLAGRRSRPHRTCRHRVRSMGRLRPGRRACGP